MRKSISIIVALDEGGGFAKNGKIPWDIPADMKHFAETTKGGICIMGRRTYEDIVGRAIDKRMKKIPKADRKKPVRIKKVLGGRESYVVTSTLEEVQGAKAVKSLHEALQDIGPTSKEIFVIGGFRMYIEALASADKVYVTILKGRDYDCDARFPVWLLSKWFQITNGKETDELYFVTYKRLQKPNRARKSTQQHQRVYRR